MRTLIVGAGSVGQYLATKLRLGGHDVTLLARPDAAHVLTGFGIRLRIGDQLLPVTVRATADTADPILRDPFDLAIVAVKSFSTPSAIDSLRAVRGAADASIMSIQNGLGNEELLAAAFGARRVVAAALTTAAKRPEPGVVEASAKGGLVLAPVGDLSHNWILAALEPTGLKVRAARDWRAVKWSKLALNLLGNATCAVLDWPPGSVYANHVAFSIERRYLLETMEAMSALNISPINLIDFPSRALFAMARSLPAFLLRRVLYRRVTSARGNKLPSLLIDVRAGKQQLEVTSLNGAVAERAAAAGVDAPANATAVRLLMGIVRGEVDWDRYRANPLAFEEAIESSRRAYATA